VPATAIAGLETSPMSGGQRVFVGLVAGAVIGLALGRAGPEVAGLVVPACRRVGTVWLHALQMTVLPLVVSLLVVGVAQVADVAASGRIARRTLAWILALAFGSAALSAVVAPALLGLLPRSSGLQAALQSQAPATAQPAEGAAHPTALDGLTSLVPSNVITAAAENAIAPLVVFTLVFAFALTRITPARRESIVDLAQGVVEAMTVVVGWVLWLAPVGVLALVLPVAATAGSGALGALGWYVLVLVAVYLVVTLAAWALAWGRGLRPFARSIFPAQCVAAVTQSSLASLPAMLESARELGYPPSVRGLALPLTVTLLRITSPAQYITVACFIAWAQGGQLAPATLAVLVPLAVVISLGSVGLPGAASFMGTTMPVVQAAGLPVEPLGLLLAVDLIPDIAATVGNVTADLVVADRVARGERY